jgi:hypothetical protein
MTTKSKRMRLGLIRANSTSHTGRGDTVSQDIKMSHIQTSEDGDPKFTSETKRTMTLEINLKMIKFSMIKFKNKNLKNAPQRLRISPLEKGLKVSIMRMELD